MAKKRFANVERSLTPASAPPPPSPPERPKSTAPVQANRAGQKQISGYFSPEMHAALKITAIKRGITLQQAMVESFDGWLRDNGESPIGG